MTVVSCVEELLEPLGSFSSAKALAVLEIVPPRCAGSTVTSTVTVQVAPFAREARVQLTVFPELAEQSPPSSCTASTESAAGTVSRSATFVPLSGPSFFTTRSYE